ncbi:MAG: aminopeptidase P family protein [Clostridia bacterium]|nr:aminopeptidase P family protein [Clostridia bacterium]
MAISDLQKFLKNKSEAIIITSPENRRYFTGFPSSDGYLVITKNDAVLFVDSRYIEAAEKGARDCRAVLFKRAGEDIKEYLKENKILKAYTERNRISVSTADFLKTAFLPCRVTPSKRLEAAIDESRIVKTAEAVESIKAAQKIAEEAFNHVLTFIKPGVTEKQIALELDFYMLSHGAEAISFETIAVTGAKSSMPHGVPDDSVVKSGDFITMDFGAVVNGYHSDMTRTVAVGQVTEEQRKVYETVLAAQKTALAALKAGLNCSQADKAARDVIDNAGYGEYFGHSTGHGVGIEIHEAPTLAPRSKGKLQVGNVVTIEPGIYLPGRFGVRIEDMALITENGYENLTATPKELIVL